MKRLIVFLILLCGYVFAETPDFLNQPSKKELFSRAREVLRISLENGDLSKAGEALEYLQANVDNGAPLLRFEEYLILSELNRYEEAIPIYANIRRMSLDSAYKYESKKRLEANDALNSHLYKNLSAFNREKADSLYNRALQSDASKENKDLYGVLLYSELVNPNFGRNLTQSYYTIIDTASASEFLKKARDFVYNYPMSEHSIYLKNQIIPFVQKVLDNQREFETNPWAYKYYTGGLALVGGTWTGFMNGEASKYLDTKIGTSFIMEAEFQISRFSLMGYMGFGMVSRPKGKLLDAVSSEYWEDSESEVDAFVGLSLGYTVFESRFIKVTPFIGFGDWEYTLFDWENFPQWNLGFNVDSHLWMSKPMWKGQVSWGILFRFKYMILFGELSEEGSHWWNGSDLPKIRAGTINHIFAFELGLFTW